MKPNRLHRRGVGPAWLLVALVPAALAPAALGCGDPTPTGNGGTTQSSSGAGATAGTTASGNATASTASTTGAGGSDSAPTPSQSAEPTARADGPPPTASGAPIATAPTAATTTNPTPNPTTVATAVPTTEPAPIGSVPPAPTSLPPPKAGTADAVAGEIDQVFADRTRFSAKFHQKHKQRVAGVEREQRGTVLVERPNKISFRYDPPNKNRIVSDGVTLKVYVAEDQQLFEHPVKNTEYPGAFSFIMGEGMRKSFNLEFNEKAKFDPGPVLFGKPRTPQAGYESAQFYIDKGKLASKDPGAVAGVLVLDAQGNRNRFELTESKFIDKIDPAEFQFAVPAGTSIVK